MPPKPKDPRTNPEDRPEDGALHPEDDSREGEAIPEEPGRTPRRRRTYHLSEEGRERLSELGKTRWAAESAAVEREAQLAQLGEQVQEAAAVPLEARLREVVNRKVGSLPAVTGETIIRVNGVDYRIEDGRLKHLWFPPGEKTEFEDSQWFQFGGRAYRVHDGALSRVPPSTILAHLLDVEG